MESSPFLNQVDMEKFRFLHLPRNGYVFVVTYGRSGSTLLQHLLNAIPGYCIRGENGNAVYHLCRLIDSLGLQKGIQKRSRKSGNVRGASASTDPWYGVENIDVDHFAKGLFDVFCREVLAMPDQVRVGGFKEIRYIEDLNFLPRELEIIQKYFPRAKIIFLTRDHRLVSQSAWWKTVDQAKLFEKLQSADKAFSDYAESHPNCFQLDYSSYAGGAAALALLFDFLEEPMDRDAVEKILGQQLVHLKDKK